MKNLLISIVFIFVSTQVFASDVAQFGIKTNGGFSNYSSSTYALKDSKVKGVVCYVTALTEEKYSDNNQYWDSSFNGRDEQYLQRLEAVAARLEAVKSVKAAVTEKPSNSPQMVISHPWTISVACLQVAPIVIKNIAKGEAGEDVVFSDVNKSRLKTFFGNIKVRRIYDEENGAMIYVPYQVESPRLIQSKYKQIPSIIPLW